MKKLYKDQYILITGAAGFIGSCLVSYFNDKGYHNLVLVDDLGQGEKWKNLRQKHFIELISKHELEEWVEGREKEIEGIIHLGACSTTTETDGDYLYANNYRYSIWLAEFALQYDIPFIFASSASTYGDGARGFVDDHEMLQTLCPMNRYGFSKHTFDLWAYFQELLDHLTSLKYFNVFGPNEYHKGSMASMVFHGYRQIQEQGYIELFASHSPQYKDGEQVRDFIYVKDVVEMTAEFLTSGIKGVYNIGTGQPTSWNTLMKGIFQTLGLPEDIRYVDMSEKLRISYQSYTCADMTKYHAARKKAGLAPLKTTSIPSAVEDYVRNYLEAKDSAGDYGRW